MKSGKYKIEFDQHKKITTYDEVILKNNLLFKKEIDAEIQNQIYRDTADYAGYYKALKYIAIKMRSVKEIYNYLESKGIVKDEQDKIVEKLKKNGFLNDQSFVVSFVADKIHLTNMGPYQIKRELENHNIEEDMILKELCKYDNSIFEKKLQKLIQKKVSLDHKHSKYQLQQKLFIEFSNLGYEKEQIRQALEKVSYSDQEKLKREYDILYRRLSKKYEGEILRSHMKNKLYQKGFTMDDINDVLEIEVGR